MSGGGGSSGFNSVCLWHQGGVIASSHPHFQVHFLFLTHTHHKKTIEVSQVLYICFVYFYLYSILLCLPPHFFLACPVLDIVILCMTVFLMYLFYLDTRIFNIVSGKLRFLAFSKVL